MISIILPVYNERDNLEPLTQQLLQMGQQLTVPFECIFVDDGSQDGSGARLCELAARHESWLRVVLLRRNFGQSAALMAGIDHASGDVIIPMDADLQNDPADIPRLLAQLDQGFDVVSGWRKTRHDQFFSRNLPSYIANSLISKISGIPLHDYGCTLKAYRREVIEDIRLYGEMHRFIPIYASRYGARITEMVVTHHPRIHGQSKYGWNRVWKVILDLMVVQFMGQWFTKPIYMFGGFGLFSIVLSGGSSIYAFYLKFFEHTSLIQTPLPMIAIFTFLLGILSIFMGFIAETLIRTYYESQQRTIYLVREKHNFTPKS